jgi:hypothetical protein
MRPGEVVVEDSVRHTWRSSSDKTGQAASSSSVSVAGVSVTMTSAGSSPSATRWAVYHHGASPKRAAVLTLAEPVRSDLAPRQRAATHGRSRSPSCTAVE